MLKSKISHDMHGILKMALAWACQVGRLHRNFSHNVYTSKFYHPSHNTNKVLVE